MNSAQDIVARLLSPQFLWVVLWTLLGALTLALLALLMTRWGRKQPVQKCTILSVWFHLLLVIYATSIQIVPERFGPGNQVTINLGAGEAVRTESPDSQSAVDKMLARASPRAVTSPVPATMSAPKPRLATEAPTAPRVATILPPVTASRPTTSPSDLSVPAPRPASPPTAKAPPAAKVPEPKTPPKADTAAAPPQTTTPTQRTPPTTRDQAKSKSTTEDRLTRIDTPSPLADIPDPTIDVAPKPAEPLVPVEPMVTLTPERDSTALDVGTLARPSAPPIATPPTDSGVARLVPIAPAAGAAMLGPTRRSIDEPHILPPIYQERTASDRVRIAAAHGGSARTEAAVDRSLRWLSTVQDPNGRWDARRFGAGRESQALGRDRGGAGADADTGVTGLALLAFLGAGHTHQRGDHQEAVRRGLQYLIDAQHPNGNLGGGAQTFAFMYCHGMATLAMSEALAMTGDQQLREPVQHAIQYTLSAQHPSTGGWRYKPGDLGDLSQLGWQLMALKSAELGGIEIPTQTKSGMANFLQSVSSGSYGGLGSYRPGEQVSPTMTAEALVCRQFLGMPRENPAGAEAGNFLLTALPGAGDRNFYYWYYGTLGMYQLQGDHWTRWNDAVTRQLLDSQVPDGDLAGSWEANDMWGGYGGRIYSTALATLCLEVYYRYLPLYVEAAANGQSQRK